MSKEIGITAKRSDNFSDWYVQVVIKAGLADYSAVKGFIILRPYGYAIWERIQKYVNYHLKKTGHENAYFPVLIPESLLSKEAEHFAGFVPEVFWVTHAGNNKLGDRLATRPTSETIAYASFGKWIRSWRDLPLLLNFWNSVLRAEIKATRPFIRTSEFLWQEGHTVHATKEETDAEVMMIAKMYRKLMEEVLAIPVQVGYKSDKEKFVGAVYTITLEGMMPDGKALQMGTSHNLGQNFSKPFEIKFLGKDSQEHFAWQASWGISWRLIGATVMAHGDDKGLVLPPRIAPIQCVIVTIFYKEADRDRILSKAKEVFAVLSAKKIRAFIDDREQYTPGWKFNEWEMKGVPLRIEIGPRDVEKGQITVVRRDTSEKFAVKIDSAASEIKKILVQIQNNLHGRALKLSESKTKTAKSYGELKSYVEVDAGFVKSPWCGRRECEAQVKEETGADIRLIPLEEEKLSAKCLVCGQDAKHTAYFARAY
ncbi:MAG: proline--tRNA ligase [Thaumarchaeota archaeon]|nr:proline--tRNA ligase [Nitrososphaerota archaeon]